MVAQPLKTSYRTTSGYVGAFTKNQGLGFKVQGSGFRVWGLRFGIQVLRVHHRTARASYGCPPLSSDKIAGARLTRGTLVMHVASHMDSFVRLRESVVLVGPLCLWGLGFRVGCSRFRAQGSEPQALNLEP